MSRELKTGIIALIVIALGIWGYNFLKGQDIFTSGSRKFFIEYDNVNGLSKTSAVTINGLQVGKVNNIAFHSEAQKKGKLLVEILVSNNFEFSKNSVAKIYSAGLMGGQNIKIIPSYEGDNAVSGDYLKGGIESDLFASLGNQLDPIKSKLDNVLVSADSLLVGLNQVLDKKARESLNRSLIGLEGTISDVRKTLASVNGLVAVSKNSLNATLANTEKITTDFSKVSEDLTQANLGGTVKNLEATLANVNSLLANVKNGKGTLGKLMSDDKMYTNLTNASKEMEELLREMKLNPKRFVHFSLFGKKPKPYNKENNNKNISNSQKKG